MKTEVIVAIIEASGVIVAAILTSAALLFSAFAVFSKKRLRKMLKTALNDLQYFQYLEKVHVEMEIGRTGKSNKLMARATVRDETGLIHSGMAMSAVKRKLQSLDSVDD